MSHCRLEKMFASMPEHIKVKAIHDHIQELSTAGELAKAHGLFDSLCSLPDHDTIKAQSAWQLVRHFINHASLTKAQACYGVLEGLEQSDIVQEIRAKAAHILVNALLPQYPHDACHIWLNLAGKLSSNGLEWLLARTGLLLLQHAYQHSDTAMMRTIYQALRCLPPAPHSQNFMAQAEKIMQRQGIGNSVKN